MKMINDKICLQGNLFELRYLNISFALIMKLLHLVLFIYLRGKKKKKNKSVPTASLSLVT